MINIKCYYNDENAPFEGVSFLLKDAFKERTEAGMNFMCANFSANDVKVHTKDNYLFVAYNEHAKIVGTVTLTMYKKRKEFFGSHDYLAVSPLLKHTGVGSLLFDALACKAKELNLDYIVSTTAEEAFSSIRYHMKNGFVIYKYGHYQGKLYNSYFFIYPLTKRKFLRCTLFRAPILFLSKVYTKCSQKFI